MGRSRIFAAWKVPDAAAAALHDFGGSMLRSLESAGGRAKREELAKLHATLHFLGDVDDALVPALSAALASAAGAHPAFDVVFDRGGAFPPRGKPRVVFAAVAEGGAAALVALTSEVQRALLAAGAPRPDKPFHPHVTLMRVKAPPRGRWQPPAIAAPVRARVDGVVLFKSTLAREGAIHEAIATGSLR